MTADQPTAGPWTADRLTAAQNLLERQELDGIVLTPGSDLLYLAGYQARPFERLTCLVVPRSGDPVLVVPALEASDARACPAAAAGVDVYPWDETENPARTVAQVLSGARRVGLSGRAWFEHALALRAVLPAAEWTVAGEILDALRLRKSPAELAEIAHAAECVDRTHKAIADGAVPVVGRAEYDILADVRALLVDSGHREAGTGVVASGPNSGAPHHLAGDRRVRPGDVLLIDVGGAGTHGYRSDCTRMYVVDQSPDEEFDACVGIVEQAYQAAFAAAGPGVLAAAVDRAAREVIASSGYGPAFTHRTGHGIGLDVHEPPYLVGGNDMPLQPGMCFSIEPAIYLAGRHGSRIEDIVTVTDTGVYALNTTSHQVQVLTS
jgi:Xaa-Pro aminopeptidase